MKNILRPILKKLNETKTCQELGEIKEGILLLQTLHVKNSLDRHFVSYLENENN